MNQTKVMLAVIEMARMGGAMPADEAISHVAALIDRLDMHSETYEVEVLLAIGATIWTLEQGRIKPRHKKARSGRVTKAKAPPK